jgi:galactokinase
MGSSASPLGNEEKLVAAGLSAAEAARKARLFDAVVRRLDAFGGESGEEAGWFVPGRIEVFGKHTDYAGGRSLLCAVERGFCVAARPRADRVVRIADAALNLEATSDFSEDTAARPGEDWTAYPAAVVRRIARDFPGSLRGADIAFASDLPRSAGLSSGSALVVAVFTALAGLNALEEHPAYRANIKDPDDLAGYLGAVENGLAFGSLGGGRGVGTFGGSEDHTAILRCRAGKLSQYSFCPVRFEREVSLPLDWTFAVASSGVEAEKAGAARERYNRLSLATSEVLDLWRKATGKTAASLGEVVSAPGGAEQMRWVLAESPLSSRFEQFLEESESLVPAAAEAFARGDGTALRDIASRSQAGAERRLGNQIPETVALVSSALSLGAVAASAFGAGFGGSVWAAVPATEAADFRSSWERDYRRRFSTAGLAAEFFLTRAGPGTLALG